ncbi:HipA family kinase [Sphingomonas endolithica]|uniref:HipA family kinase n=1 Tax=Sphingomonas endolithica TaxID=2972485 RepID=UPI0021AF76B8|nr:HipA family kinase [Sphingomonas sp. ZFBP2030]
MIRYADAIRFDRLAERGRNEPLRVTAETDQGDEIEVFLKPSARPEIGIEGMANEIFAACVGSHVGVPVCEPIAVRMSSDWISSVQDPLIRDVLSRSSPVAFGSLAAGSGWRRWTSDERLIGERRGAALSTFVFDAFIENRDRVVSNPNLLIRGDSFRVIDHELCFRIRLCLFPRAEPWRMGYLQNTVSPGATGHVFGALLKADRYVDFTPIRPAWAGLSDDALSDYAACLPTEWVDAASAIDDALTHLRTVRDRIDECLMEIERALA